MKVSLITAVFNNRATIAQALESAICQTYRDLELIVVDGGSRDGTLEVLSRYAPNITRTISEPDSGIYDALNKGIRLATGDVVGFLHSDDMLAGPSAIGRIAGAFEDSSVDAVYGDLVYVDRDDPERIVRWWRAGPYAVERLRHGWMPPHPTFYVRREVYGRLGTFDLSYRIAADYDCILRFLGREAIRPRYIPETLVRMRVGGESNRSFRNMVRKSLEDYRALRSNGVGGLYALAWKNFSKIPQFFLRPSR